LFFIRSLHNRLKELWTGFHDEMNTSVADYLSLLHLGELLEQLAQIGVFALTCIASYFSYVRAGVLYVDFKQWFLTIMF
jgi:hypothetical protein